MVIVGIKYKFCYKYEKLHFTIKFKILIYYISKGPLSLIILALLFYFALNELATKRKSAFFDACIGLFVYLVFAILFGTLSLNFHYYGP